MGFVDVIRGKRDGRALGPDEIRAFVRGVTDESLPDYQIAALLMAIVWRGMSPEETVVLTEAMAHSGVRVDLGSLPGPKVDKHSTGGVGDKTSLVLAPLAAACGVTVPMMSGRALGHTGGTLDKLESIPGFRTALSLEEFTRTLERVGCSLIGQTRDVAPGDRRLYALRDVTGTVESIPLICASILSKKIAEGIDGLVLDVKAGSGAFMKNTDEGIELARVLVTVGRRAGLRAEAVVTSMDAPLGRAVGNSVEVIESLETLKGRGPSDLEALSVLLAARMLVVAGVATSHPDAERRVRRALETGAGLEKLRDVIVAQGGDARVIDDYARLPSAPAGSVVASDRDGMLRRLDAERIGRAAMALGAGRDRVDATIDHGVGVLVRAVVGERVRRGDPVLELRYRDAGRVPVAEALCRDAIDVGEEPPATPPLVRATVGVFPDDALHLGVGGDHVLDVRTSNRP